MEADGFVRRRRMTAETAGSDPGVAGASAGAEVRWLGGRFWGVSESIVGSLTPRIGGETELQTVDFTRSAQDAQTEDTEPDYEGLPQGASTSTHMLAGAVAGIMEHCLMFPIDCVKTRMQSLQPDPAARYRNVMDALRRIVATEGVWRPMRGLNATAVGAGPAHALYFASYEKLKKTLSDVIHPGANSHLANGTIRPTHTHVQITNSWMCGHTASRRDHEPNRSREAAHADVQFAVPRRVGLCTRRVAQRGRGCLLPQLHHPAHHERALPGAPLHDLRVPPGAAEPPQTVQPLVPHVVRRLGRGHRGRDHHTSGRVQDPAQHPGVPRPPLPVFWPRPRSPQTHLGPGPRLQDGLQAGRPEGLLQGGPGEDHLPDALHGHQLVRLRVLQIRTHQAPARQEENAARGG
uniref:Solute carrier family 25 member 28 n=1 Tax=Gasterosteus aculeatus aculeatus TaxID=481459 RepID=G3NXI4_GASAC